MATYVDITAILTALHGITTGNTYYVDTAGNDANPGTYALPFLTIDFAVGACTAGHDDAIIITDSLGVGYDENVNVDGVQFDISKLTVVGAFGLVFKVKVLET